jgi:hypothetical protein
VVPDFNAAIASESLARAASSLQLFDFARVPESESRFEHGRIESGASPLIERELLLPTISGERFAPERCPILESYKPEALFDRIAFGGSRKRGLITALHEPVFGLD